MKKIVSILCLFLSYIGFSQNVTSKWFFGNGCGLDFSTTPPSSIQGNLNTLEGCATISDNNGTLLFYTDGSTVYNATGAVMPNGTGLFGNASSTQSGVIVKQPGNTNIYYVFTVDCCAGVNGLCYSIVDMTLAGGLGDVTSKNVLLKTPSSEKITSCFHCNGVDVWIITHDYGSKNYRSFLLTATGISGTGVVSSVGTIHTSYFGHIKTSPNGKQIAVAVSGQSFYELCDFDNATGMVSNPLNISESGGPYGCEFSPDGTKFYGSNWTVNKITQWDLCAGSATAIAASGVIVGPTPLVGQRGSVQLAADGKIYCTRTSTTMLDVINNPNALGTACNYVAGQQPVWPNTCQLGLPNFITSLVSPPVVFTSSVFCGYATFNANAVVSASFASCNSTTGNFPGIVWNFGDPGSGALNTSTIAAPTHSYSTTGVYNVTLTISSACLTKTMTQQISVPTLSTPVLSTTKPSICIGETSTLSLIGVNNFTWTNGPLTNTRVVQPSGTAIYSVSYANPDGTCLGSQTIQIVVQKCAGITETAADLQLYIYPNPVTEIITIENTQAVNIEMKDINGRLVYKQLLAPGKTEADLSNVSPGIYFLRAESEGRVKIYRIHKIE